MTTDFQTPLHTNVRTIDGLSIRFAESEKRDVDALLLSPWPESLFAFEPAWSRLGQHAHLVAVDLPGFGQSEGRDSLFSPRAMGDFIVRIADSFGLERPHVVGPDVGTPAALFAAASHRDRFSSLVVGSGGTAVPLQLGGALKERVEAPSLEPYRRVDPKELVSAAMKNHERYELSDAARQDYLSAYDGDRFVESMRYVRAYPAELPLLRDVLGQIETPVQIIAGRNDRVVPLVNAEYLYQRLPNSRLNVIDAGHFVWEDAAEEYASIVTAWWDGGYRSVPLRNQ